MEFGRVRADDRNSLVPAAIQGQEIVLILQQNNCLMSSFQRQLLMFGIVGNFLSVFGIDERIIEQAGQEFQPKNACNRSINHAFGNLSFPNLMNEAVEGVAKG